MIQNTNNLLKKYLARDWFCLTLILILAIVIFSPVLFIGIPHGHKDLSQHLQFATSYYNAILTGEFLPVWASSDNYGFGSVGIRFYPPISSVSLALMKLLVGNWFDAIWINFIIWMFIGCAGIYIWAKEWLPPRESLIASALYIIVPYHLLQIYQMWLYAEFISSAILPFCFLFLTRICRRGRLIDVLLFAVSYSFLLLSHIPSTIIGSLSLAVYALFLLDWSQWRKTLIRLFAAFALSLSATAFHWLKIVTEINWVKHSGSQYSSGYFDPEQQLFPLFFSAGDRYIERVSWHFDISIFLTILLFLPAIIYLGLQIRKKEHQDRKILLSLAATGLFALFMMSLPSAFIWQSIPTLQKIQFPWRWLSVLSVISVLVFACAIPRLILQSKIVRKISAYSILLLLFSILLFDLTQSIIQSEPIARVEFETNLKEMLEEPGCYCWWTTWAKKQAVEQRQKVFAESRSVNITSWRATERQFTVEEGESANIRVATFYYPYWRAQVNGQTIQVEKDEDGSILIPIEGEKASVKLYFEEPNFLKFSLILSVLTWILLSGALFLTYLKKENQII